MTALAAGVLIIGAPVLLAANSAVAAAHAGSAADAGALAAADAALGLYPDPSVDPCALAAEVARQNRASLHACDVDLATGRARVTASVRVGLFTVSRSAHAGPAYDVASSAASTLE